LTRHYGNFILFYDDEMMIDNPYYINKKFKLYWKFIKSTYPCCDGELKQIEGLQPSITKLKLTD